MPGRKAPEAIRREQILKAAYEVALRQGLDGLTVRAVAARAKLSHGLVHFHFKDRAQLVSALLDRVLATTTALQVPAVIAHIPRAEDRLRALLRQEMDRLAKEPRPIRLFFEYWALGTRHAPTRARISAELDRYRAAFRTITAEMVQTEPARSAGVTPEGLAAVAVSLVNGCAVQAMIDPAHFEIEQYLTAVEGILGGARSGRRGA
ncbi:MAG TPA: TetR family transcriptional regulator [Gemmatimonadales bacterium]|jgi:AcrR family transcriptional regulator|nr:TetR family transcriptional regulator [Gemmatimonadales bacterium]